MHRDLKLGLALAVLLIGSTAAFFFRNDADPNAGLPQLQDPERLDDEIADRDVAPYLDQIESDPAVAESAWTKPAFLGGPTGVVIHRASITPDPIQIVLEEDAELIEPAASPSRPVPTVRPAAVSGETVHVVAPGDTLTGLAETYLGSLTRYGEIYELNRDRLAGPHDLRIGMKLRIPPASPGAAVVSANVATQEAPELPESTGDPMVADEPAGEAEAGGSEPDPKTEKLFVPAKRTPFIPSRYRGRADPAAKAVPPGDARRE